MTGLRGLAWAVVFAAVSSLAGSSCFAASSAVAIGAVDIAKVRAEAPRVKQLSEKMDRLGAELDAKISVRLQHLMLTEEQVKELIDLKIKANPTEQEKARIKQITDIDRANDEELKTLQGTAQPDEKQKARLSELTEMQKKSKALADQVARDYNTQYQSEGLSLSDKADAELREVVTKIAESKKLAFVFDKDSLIFGGIDITSDVISRLDRKPE
jgi:Skp family chaperone for outer membrane proteins